MSTSTTEAGARLSDPTLLRTGAYVDGAWLGEGDEGTFWVSNPSTGERIAQLPSLSREQVGRAVDAADRALPAWRALSAKDRSRILRRWFDLVVEHGEDL